jgi:hypothetical protein
VHGLNILASKNGVVVDLVLLDTNVRLSVGIELGSLVCEVEVDGERPRKSEEDQWNAHGVSGADLVGNVAENDGDDCATADGGDEEGCTTLGVASETAKGESEDTVIALAWVMPCF